MPSEIVQVVAVTKAYDGPPIVDGVSFDLRPGELLTLLGPSGSGKSTILGMIAGFIQPSGGDVRVGGRSLLNEPPQRRNFGMVFQSYSLFPHMTVLDNVSFALRMRKVSRPVRAEAAREMLARIGLRGLEDRRPHQLSGGQQQRVALARALVYEPTALLLDEPFGALDKRLRESLQLEIKALQGRLGVSILFVTHDQDEAMIMSDRIAVLQRGQIAQIGTPSDIYLHPANTFVAQFLGDTNLIACVVQSRNGQHVTVTLTNGNQLSVRQTESSSGASSACYLAVRPERIQILSETQRTDAVAIGVVASRVFLGSQERVIVQALDQQLVIRVPATDAHAIPPPGQRVVVGWNAADAALFEDSQITQALARRSSEAVRN